MDSSSNAKGYTDEQWESLLSKTFDDPISTPKPMPDAQTSPAVTPAPKQEAPKPEATKNAAPAPSITVAKKKRKIWKVLFLLLAVFLILAITAIHIFPIKNNRTTKEQQQCMEALRQWQKAQYYQLSTFTNKYELEYNFFGYGWNMRSVYFYGDNCELNWTYTNSTMENHYVGQAKINGNQYTYSSDVLAASHWNAASKELEISQPWIMSFSLNDVQVLDQYVFKNNEDNYTTISFAVMDTDPNATYYGQGPYRVHFLFDQDGLLYSVKHYFFHNTTNSLIVAEYNLTKKTAEDIEDRIQRQIDNPRTNPAENIVIVDPAFKIPGDN